MNLKELQHILQEMEELLKKKNQMYGDENITKIGEQGITVRLEEKLERLKHLLKIQENPPEETTEDTWKDIVGYGLIGIMLRRGKWKEHANR